MRLSIIIASLIIGSSINPTYEFPLSFGISISFFGIYSAIIDYIEFKNK